MNKSSFTIRLPFVFSKKIDPRAIITVGDQVVCEHVFAFHGRESMREGFSSVISNISFNESLSEVIIRPEFSLVDSAGHSVNTTRMCAALRESLAGTSHAPIGPLVKNIKCEQTEIIIQFTALPVNIKYLLTLADFSIFDSNSLPLSKANRSVTTGPYKIDSMTPEQIRLRRNHSYPRPLVANEVEEVVLQSYSASKTKQLLDQLNPATSPLAYLYGYTVSPENLEEAHRKNYRIRQIPSEWMVYWGLNKRVPKTARVTFATAADSWRKEMLKISPFGQPAYSLSPTERPFGLTEEQYFKAIESSQNKSGGANAQLNGKYTLATLDEWAEIPIFAKGLKLAKTRFPELTIKLLPRSEAGKLWTGEIDFILSPFGISPADPLNNLAFKEEFEEIVTKKRLAELSVIKDASQFNRELIQIESNIAQERLWVPIGHFPGIVLEASGFERDENIAWSWGIQAWTYRTPSEL